MNNMDDAVISKYFNQTNSISAEGNELIVYATKFLEIENHLVWQLTSPTFGFVFNSPVEYVYNPIEYAFEVHSNFVNTYCNSTKDLLFLGMNPGPWGMMQTGVPFGEVTAVRDWLRLTGNISEPVKQHPHKRVLGFACKRKEVSGSRFWALAQRLSNQDPFKFFSNSFIYNYFPLVLLSASGKNITPADLKTADQKLLQGICDQSLLNVVQLLNTKVIIAIGRYAEKKAKDILKKNQIKEVKVVFISHPSPRNPNSNKNWLEDTVQQLQNLDLVKYFT